MSVPTTLQYLNKAGRDVTYETTDENPNFVDYVWKPQEPSGVWDRPGENNSTPQPSTHMTAQLFQEVSVE